MIQIEDTIGDDGLPVNSLAMVERLKELLKENNTNCLSDCKSDIRIRKLMWLINQQVYGQIATIDMYKEWGELTRKVS